MKVIHIIIIKFIVFSILLINCAVTNIQITGSIILQKYYNDAYYSIFDFKSKIHQPIFKNEYEGGREVQFGIDSDSIYYLKGKNTIKRFSFGEQKEIETYIIKNPKSISHFKIIRDSILVSTIKSLFRYDIKDNNLITIYETKDYILLFKYNENENIYYLVIGKNIIKQRPWYSVVKIDKYNNISTVLKDVEVMDLAIEYNKIIIKKNNRISIYDLKTKEIKRTDYILKSELTRCYMLKENFLLIQQEKNTLNNKLNFFGNAKDVELILINIENDCKYKLLETKIFENKDIYYNPNFCILRE